MDRAKAILLLHVSLLDSVGIFLKCAVIICFHMFSF